jgi:hypothetical protein
MKDVAQELASCLQVLKPNDDRVALWINAMTSGDYKFGYGLLRSADDEYDPMGVLAAISLPDWTWDDQEGGWAIHGDALFVEPVMLADWLEMQGALGRWEWVDRFQRTLASVTDGSASFGDVATLLEQARRLQASAAHRLNIRKSIPDSYRVDTDFSSLEDRVLAYHRGPFYGR